MSFSLLILFITPENIHFRTLKIYSYEFLNNKRIIRYKNTYYTFLFLNVEVANVDGILLVLSVYF